MLTDDDSVVLFMRNGCHVCARVKRYLTEHGVVFTTRDVDLEPLTPHELWGIFNRKAGRLRVPFTVLNDGEDVVLGYDPLRLEGVFLRDDLGGWQASTEMTVPILYDEFTSPALDSARWTVDVADESLVELSTGDGELLATLDARAPATDDLDTAVRIRSAQRFATPLGSTVVFDAHMAVVDALTGTHATNALVGVEDIAGRITFGFELVGGQLWALHRRDAEAGVTLADEAFVHRVLVDERFAAGETHRFSIGYDQSAARVSWHVDEACVYWASPPNPIEGCSLLMSATTGREGPGTESKTIPARQRIRWLPWRISTGTMTTDQGRIEER